MGRLFSASYRFHTWRRLWITLADCQRELGLPITEEQIAALKQVADDIDLDRVAELERRTRHDVVAHLRHFAEQADAVHPGAGGILHLGATSAFVTDNTDALLAREGLKLLAGRLAATLSALADFARRTRTI
ncbi:MAG TPA: adenylosuccinate lyase, partial [Thermoanaerobaculia bacterium]|nr:adenylosuccinate lyase [Thermoanaerobaculia bacterium]